MRTIDRDGFGPAVRDDSENLKLYLARRVQQRTAKFRCRCYSRGGYRKGGALLRFCVVSGAEDQVRD